MVFFVLDRLLLCVIQLHTLLCSVVPLCVGISKFDVKLLGTVLLQASAFEDEYTCIMVNLKKIAIK